MSDGESYPGVRAMQPADSDLSKFRMRDFPLGSAFAFPIQPSDRAARLFVADGVRLNICSAAIEEVEEDDSEGVGGEGAGKAKLSVSTSLQPHEIHDEEEDDGEGDYMTLWEWRRGEAPRTVTGLGLSVSGPTTLSVGVSGDAGVAYVNLFGTVVANDQPNTHEDGEEDSDDDIFMAYDDEDSDDVFVDEEDFKNELAALAAARKVGMDKESDDDCSVEEGGKSAGSTKRKLDSKGDRDQQVASSEDKDEVAKRLTKKQRKELAKKKAKELAEVVAMREGHLKEGDKEAKKFDAHSKKIVPPKSLTSERRLDGGILVRDIVVGAGAAVKPGRSVSINYEGSLLSDGKVFDKNKSKANPFTFRPGTGEVIKGLDKGIVGMKVEGERVITIPPAMGYGRKGSHPSIPSDATLVFTVNVLKVGGK